MDFWVEYCKEALLLSMSKGREAPYHHVLLCMFRCRPDKKVAVCAKPAVVNTITAASCSFEKSASVALSWPGTVKGSPLF